MKILLKKGAEIESKDNQGRTPLSHAAGTYGELDNVKILLEKGADIESKDNERRTPLSHASQKADTEVIWFLLEAGSKIDSEDNKGRTPMWYVSERADSGYGVPKGLLASWLTSRIPSS